jgi:hypothetical protein
VIRPWSLGSMVTSHRSGHYAPSGGNPIGVEDMVEVTASEVAPAIALLEVDDALVASRRRRGSRRSEARTSVRGEGRGGSTGRSGASPVLGSWWSCGVPDDNKSVAETGERHLLGGGSGALMRERHEAR